MTVRDLIETVGPDGLDRELSFLLQGAKGIGCSREITNIHCVDHASWKKSVCIYGRNDTLKIDETKEVKKHFADIKRQNREYAKAHKNDAREATE